MPGGKARDEGGHARETDPGPGSGFAPRDDESLAPPFFHNAPESGIADFKIGGAMIKLGGAKGGGETAGRHAPAGPAPLIEEADLASGRLEFSGAGQCR